jgi:hypothetical protein
MNSAVTPLAAIARRIASRTSAWVVTSSAVVCGHRFAVDEDRAAGRRDQAIDVPQKCRLTAAGRAHQAEDLALMDVEIDVQ